jgi:PAS domain S-box-containing protein
MPNHKLAEDELLLVPSHLTRQVTALEKSESGNTQTNEFARDIESIFSSLMEHAPIHVFIKDEATRSIRLSNNYEKMLGRPLNELRNKTVDELFPPEFAKGMMADDLRILNNNRHDTIEEEFNGRTYSTIKFPIIIESKNKYLAGFMIDITEQKKMEIELSETIHLLRKTLGATIGAMATAVEARDPYTAGHQRRVADLARSIATEINLQKHQKEGLRMASAIHDIGKISIPAEILSKPTKMTPMEFALIKFHPQTGYDILKDIEFSCPIARIILEHHERLDGSGYPNGLKDENLLIESKVLMVADVVEAMASHRPYRPSLGIEIVLDHIMKSKNVLFDPSVVDACICLFRDKGYHLWES